MLEPVRYMWRGGDAFTLCMKVGCYPNATAAFQFMKILKSGDVALNSGR